MIFLGLIRVINTDYKVYIHRDYKEINELSKAWDKKYDLINGDKPSNVSGFCLITEKEVHIYNGFDSEYTLSLLRHELWHALLYEIGCPKWEDEELIEQLVVWNPIMNGLMNRGKELFDNDRIKKEPSSKETCVGCISKCE